MSVDVEALACELASLKHRVAALEGRTIGAIVGKLIGQRPRSTSRSVVSFSQAQARQRALRHAALDPGAFLNTCDAIPFARAGAPAESGAAAGSAILPAVRYRIGLFGRAATALVILWRWGRLSP
jgi:hypothetical protein